MEKQMFLGNIFDGEQLRKNEEIDVASKNRITFESFNSETIRIGPLSYDFAKSVCSLFTGTKSVFPTKIHTFETIVTALQMKELQHKFYANKCSIDKLTVPDECPGYTEAKELFLNILQHIPQAALDNLCSARHLKDHQTFTIPHFKDRTWQAADKTKHNDIRHLEDVVIKIRVHKPFSHNPASKAKLHSPQIQQEVLVLGRQTLDSLRDVIVCPNHYVKREICSENLQQHDIPNAKDRYKSGFFYFGDTFYNDMRDPNNIDYSAVIHEWAAQNSKCQYGNMNAAVMENTRFKDLTVRFGYPYVYQHLGDCEHLLIFVNFHLIGSGDNLCSRAYPLHRAPHRQSVQLCILCGFFKACWITFNNSRVPHDPAYFCDTCYIAFNFKNGEKVGNFTAHPFSEYKPIEHWNTLFLGNKTKESKREKQAKKEIAELVVPPRLFAPPNLYTGHPTALLTSPIQSKKT